MRAFRFGIALWSMSMSDSWERMIGCSLSNSDSRSTGVTYGQLYRVNHIASSTLVPHYHHHDRMIREYGTLSILPLT